MFGRLVLTALRPLARDVQGARQMWRAAAPTTTQQSAQPVCGRAQAPHSPRSIPDLNNLRKNLMNAAVLPPSPSPSHRSASCSRGAGHTTPQPQPAVSLGQRPPASASSGRRGAASHFAGSTHRISSAPPLRRSLLSCRPCTHTAPVPAADVGLSYDNGRAKLKLPLPSAGNVVFTMHSAQPGEREGVWVLLRRRRRRRRWP